jgi:hypothetical protein
VIRRLPLGEYGPELIALMGKALDCAWLRVKSKAADVELARLVMASAIIDGVDAGVREHDDLVGAAISALSSALRLAGGEVDPSAIELSRRLRK